MRGKREREKDERKERAKKKFVLKISRLWKKVSLEDFVSENLEKVTIRKKDVAI